MAVDCLRPDGGARDSAERGDGDCGRMVSHRRLKADGSVVAESPSSVSGLQLRVQSAPTPTDEGSWAGRKHSLETTTSRPATVSVSSPQLLCGGSCVLWVLDSVLQLAATPARRDYPQTLKTITIFGERCLDAIGANGVHKPVKPDGRKQEHQAAKQAREQRLKPAFSDRVAQDFCHSMGS